MAGESGPAYELGGLAVPESLNLLHDLFERVRGDWPGVDETDLLMFETAIVEIHGNVVEHGHPPGKVVYAFALEVQPDRIVGLLADTGSPVPDLSGLDDGPPDELAEGGRGLWLAKATLDELDYVRIGDRNTWRLLRLRSGAASRT